jgi:hypothetical protein
LVVLKRSSRRPHPAKYTAIQLAHWCARIEVLLECWIQQILWAAREIRRILFGVVFSSPAMPPPSPQPKLNFAGSAWKILGGSPFKNTLTTVSSRK